MKKSLLVTLLFSLSVSTVAQEPAAWKHDNKVNPLTDKVVDSFVLDGKYLTPPSILTPGSPSILVVCLKGKFKVGYINIGAVVNHTTDSVEGPSNIDGKKGWFRGTLSTSGTAVFFRQGELNAILKAHKMILGFSEAFAGEVVMQFDMPDPALVLSTCSK